MAKKTKMGSINVPASDFEDENITAHISIRLPLNLVKSLKKLSLNEHYEGRYQTLIRDILLTYTEKNKTKNKSAG
jgi:metal-responsive CopG/Arc/MetJ family transcriptional regulator